MPKEEDRKQVLKLLPIAAGIQDARTFANQILGLRPSFWSMVVGGDQFPDRRLTMLEVDFRRRFRTFTFDRRHLDLSPSQFVELFAREPVYATLRAAIDLAPQPPAPPPHPLERFFGYFFGLYICRDPADRSKEAVAIDPYKISALDADDTTAKIEQLTNAFTTRPSIGRLRMLWDTVEIEIGQGTAKDPDALYMASAPKGDEVNGILAIGTDIKFGTRLVVARPTLFVRVPEAEVLNISETYAAGTPLHAAVKAIFSKYVVFDTERFELAPKAQLEEADELAMKLAVAALRRESEPTEPAGEPDGD
jgi:hypothetical protein